MRVCKILQKIELLIYNNDISPFTTYIFYIKMSLFNLYNNKYPYYCNKISSYIPIQNSTMSFNLDHITIEKYTNNALSNLINTISVFGYSKKTNTYWCKKLNNNECMLHIELNITYTKNNQTLLTITPIIGANIYINNFIIQFYGEIFKFINKIC